MTTRRHPIRFAAVGLAMSGLMALAACGGDDSGDDNDSTTTEVTAEAGDDTATEDTAADDTATDDTASDDSTDTTFDTSDVEALSAEECQKFLGLGFDPTSSDEPDDPGAAFDAIEDAVPDDLKADIRVLREGYENLIEASEQYQDDVTNPEYLEAVQAVSTPEFNEASARLAAFFENCEEAVTD
jgi:hypothetical protein